jgi:hypothetical protein
MQLVQRSAFPSASTSRSVVFRRLSLGLTVSVLALLGAEAALRVAAKVSLRERGMAFDPELGWRLVPSLRKLGEEWGNREPAWTNSRGWRDAETSLAKPPGTRRIVALGDSFTFGVSADYGERFTERLERAFPRLEVINLGVNAFGTDQELRSLELEGILYDPDIVLLIVFVHNDFDDIRYERRFHWPRPHYELEGGRLRLVRPEPSWDVRIRNASYLGEVGFRLVHRYLPASRRAEAWRTVDSIPLFLALVRRIEAISREHGARLLVVVTGLGKPGERERAVAGLLRAGVPMVDTKEEIERHTRAGRDLTAPSGHWNAEGHRVVTEVIARELRSRGWLEESGGR